MYNILPHIAISCNELVLEKHLQIPQELHFAAFGTAFHWSRGGVHRIALWLLVLGGCAGNIFARVLMHTPTISGRSVALHSVITTIGCAFRHVHCHLAILQSIGRRL